MDGRMNEQIDGRTKRGREGGRERQRERERERERERVPVHVHCTFIVTVLCMLSVFSASALKC